MILLMCLVLPSLFSLLMIQISLFMEKTYLTILSDIMNNELKKIFTWLNVNKLSININKTHYIIFRTPRRFVQNCNIFLNGQCIERTMKTKFL